LTERGGTEKERERERVWKREILCKPQRYNTSIKFSVPITL
jgi:hypothetical protein